MILEPSIYPLFIWVIAY